MHTIETVCLIILSNNHFISDKIIVDYLILTRAMKWCIKKLQRINVQVTGE